MTVVRLAFAAACACAAALVDVHIDLRSIASTYGAGHAERIRRAEVSRGDDDGATARGEVFGEGMVDPDEYQVFKPLLNERSLKPIIGRTRGAKAQKLVYAGRGAAPTNQPSNSPASRKRRSAA